jgi:hypothetical protein
MFFEINKRVKAKVLHITSTPDYYGPVHLSFYIQGPPAERSSSVTASWRLMTRRILSNPSRHSIHGDGPPRRPW